MLFPLDLASVLLWLLLWCFSTNWTFFWYVYCMPLHRLKSPCCACCCVLGFLLLNVGVSAIVFALCWRPSRAKWKAATHSVERWQRRPTVWPIYCAVQSWSAVDCVTLWFETRPLSTSPSSSNWFSSAKEKMSTWRNNEWMKIYKWRLTISTRYNVYSQRQVFPQAKNTVTLEQYNPQNSLQNPQTGTIGIHNFTFVLHKRFGGGTK